MWRTPWHAPQDGWCAAITGEEIELIGSGRTDAGVHSLGQTANFKTESNIPIEKFAKAINSKLKKSIVIKSAEEVEERFHSRYCVKSKTYERRTCTAASNF